MDDNWTIKVILEQSGEVEELQAKLEKMEYMYRVLEGKYQMVLQREMSLRDAIRLKKEESK